MGLIASFQEWRLRNQIKDLITPGDLSDKDGNSALVMFCAISGLPSQKQRNKCYKILIREIHKMHTGGS